MPFTPIGHKPIEYLTVYEPVPSGPSIGCFDGRDIPQTIDDAFGRRYEFVGVAPRDWKGRIDVDALADGEFIVGSGLVYRIRKSPTVTERLWARLSLWIELEKH